MDEIYDVPEKKGDEEISPPEIKPLPEELSYEYLDETKRFLVIISTNLSKGEKNKFMKTLRSHRKAFRYSMDGLKGINPSICTHRIFMEEGAEPMKDYQHELNPEIKGVVRKGVIRLLDAGIIFPIADSKWVSPVHYVPKNGRIKILPNKNNELFPTRTIFGYRICIDYRKLNKETRKDHYPLPINDQMLERLATHSHFYYLDGYSGFSQIAVHPDDQEKTIFTSPFGMYASRRMPFGLRNAPATFQ